MNTFEHSVVPHSMSSYSRPNLDAQKFLLSSPTIMSAFENIIYNSKHKYIKRPTNSYILWSRDRRREIRLDHPSLGNRAVNKLLGAEWKLLTIEEKRPYIDEAKRLREQHMRDYPDYKYRHRSKRKSVMNTLEPSVVPHNISSYSPPTFEPEEFMSNPPVSAYDTENCINPLTRYIPTYDMYSTTYPTISYDSNPQCAENWTFTSMATHNAQSQAVPPYQYTFMNSEQNAYGHELNLSDSVLSNTSSSSLNHHGSPESPQHTGQSLLHL